MIYSADDSASPGLGPGLRSGPFNLELSAQTFQRQASVHVVASGYSQRHVSARRRLVVPPPSLRAPRLDFRLGHHRHIDPPPRLYTQEELNKAVTDNINEALRIERADQRASVTRERGL